MLNHLKIFFNASYKAGKYTFIDHDGIEHAGYLAFLLLLSFFPFLVFIVMIAGQIGQMDIGVHFLTDIQTLFPDRVLSTIKPRIEEIASGPPQGLVTIALIGIIWTASAVIEGSRTILNRAYRVSNPRHYVWRRAWSIAQFFILAILVIFAMTMQIFAPVLWEHFHVWLELSDDLVQPSWSYIRIGFTSFLLFLAVASSYYYLPNIKQKLINVAPGAVYALLLWLGAAELFSTYLQNVDTVNLIYGSLAGIIATLIFFYIIALIYIFGAEFNYFYEKALGHRFEQKDSS